MLIPFLFSCNRQPNPPLKTTFYHWQTTLAPDTTARALLAKYDCDRLYVKAFDVAWNAGQPEPTALIRLEDTAGLPALVPVVFITNEVMSEQPADRLKELADDVVGLVEELLPQGFGELQLDCDWTARTQVQYFAFLTALRERLGTGRELTCTVRLHQYRAPRTQGIPPVGRATLMAYNVGDLNRWETENSIIDTNILKTYLSGAEPYPLHLDLAVAVYDWAAVYRRDNLSYLINEPDLAELKDTSRFRALSNDDLRYEIIQSTYFDGIYLYEGDLLRREVASPDLMEAQAALLRRYVAAFPGQRLMVYRVGSRLWN
ncbi:hypothetical protein [Neolewinella persica]|uniref:hypothetical protein n=1 Tax=Neolewinella persica TaxID=70998 RepID=UPI0012F77328|nr:hypothetical protein [Neolewinella persica]